MTIANSDGWNRRGLTRGEYTIQIVHVGGGAKVHDPARVLERHQVQGGDEAGLIPHSSGWSCWRGSEDGVGLRTGAHDALAAPALVTVRGPATGAVALLPPTAWRRNTALEGPWVVAEPGPHGAVAPLLSTAAALLPASTGALAAPAALFIAALALLATPGALGSSASGHRGGGAAPWRSAGGARGSHHSKCSRGLLVVGEAQLFEGEHFSCPREGRQHGGVGDVVDSGGVARVEAAKETEDELGVLDCVIDVPEGSSLDLEPLVVLVDRRITLLQGVEFLQQEDGPGRTIGAEESLDGDPQLAGSLVLVSDGEVENRVIDGVEDPATDGALCDVPRWIRSHRRRPVDVGTEAEFPAQSLEERSPLGEVGVLHLQGHRDVSFHIDGCVGVDDDSLGWSFGSCGGGSGSSNDCVVVARHGCRERWRGRGAEAEGPDQGSIDRG